MVTQTSTHPTRSKKTYLLALVRSGIMLLVRLYMLVSWAISGTLMMQWPVALIVALESYYSLRNGLVAESFQSWKLSIASQLGYAASWLALPVIGNQPAAALPYFGISLILDAWALYHLKDCFTAGGASYVREVTTGPYKYFAHPQYMARCVVICGYAATGADLKGCFVAAAASTVVVLMESDFRGAKCGAV